MGNGKLLYSIFSHQVFVLNLSKSSISLLRNYSVLVIVAIKLLKLSKIALLTVKVNENYDKFNLIIFRYCCLCSWWLVKNENWNILLWQTTNLEVKKQRNLFYKSHRGAVMIKWIYGKIGRWTKPKTIFLHTNTQYCITA